MRITPFNENTFKLQLHFVEISLLFRKKTVMKTQPTSLQSQVSASPKNRIKMSRVPECLYLLPGRAAVQQRDALVDQALVGASVLAEDLLHRQAVLKHLHLFLLLQRHLQPLLSLQDLVLQRRLQLLQSRQRIQSVRSCSYFFDGEHRPSHYYLDELRVGHRDGDVLVQAGRLPRGEHLTVAFKHRLLLQVDPQHVAVLPLLVRQVVQDGSDGLRHGRIEGRQTSSMSNIPTASFTAQKYKYTTTHYHPQTHFKNISLDFQTTTRARCTANCRRCLPRSIKIDLSIAVPPSGTLFPDTSVTAQTFQTSNLNSKSPF